MKITATVFSLLFALGQIQALSVECAPNCGMAEVKQSADKHACCKSAKLKSPNAQKIQSGYTACFSLKDKSVQGTSLTLVQGEAAAEPATVQEKEILWQPVIFRSFRFVDFPPPSVLSLSIIQHKILV